MAADDEKTIRTDTTEPAAGTSSAAAKGSGGHTVGGSAGSSTGVSSGGGRAGRVVTALVIVVLIAAVAVLGYLLWQDQRRDALRESAADEASRLVIQLATYDHTNVDANLDAVVAEATPGFADRYREVSEGLRELLSSGEGTSTGTVTNAAVDTLDGDTAVVLVFLDQEVTNVTVPDGRIDSSRMVVTVVRDGDRWLLEDAQLA